MRIRIGCAVVLILSLSWLAHAQGLLPEWSAIVPGISARNHFTVDANQDMMSIVSAAASIRIDNAARLAQALHELREQQPDTFDAVFAKYDLALQ